MLTSIKGYYEKGQVVLSEEPPVLDKTDVIITFLTEKVNQVSSPKRLLGTLSGKISVPENFNDPLEDLKDYM